MCNLARVNPRTLAEVRDPVEHGDRRVGWCGLHLGGEGGAVVLIDQQEVGKSAPYVNAEPVRHPYNVPIRGTPFRASGPCLHFDGALGGFSKHYPYSGGRFSCHRVLRS
jgi:hypothetical protein